MLRFLKYADLTLIVLLIFEFSIWSFHKGKVWWLAPLPLLIIFFSIISRFKFGKKEALLNKILNFVWNKLLVTKLHALTILFLLLFTVLIGARIVVKAWPEAKDFLEVQVYEGSPIPGNYKIGAIVSITTFPGNKPQKKEVGSDGIARFRVKVKIRVTIIIECERGGLVMIGGVPGFIIQSLPYLLSVNILDIPRDGWRNKTEEGIGTDILRTSLSIQSVDEMLKLDNIGLARIGDPAFQKTNSPWGVPKAEIVINRTGYILGYNPKLRIPRWVTYSIENVGRYDIERPSYVPDRWISLDSQASIDDYRGSGYDRGHLVSIPDLHSKGQEVVNKAGFFSTFVPQTPNMNRRTWAVLEEYTRTQVEKGSVMFVTAGPVFMADSGSNVIEYFTIGVRNIAVPTHLFRIIARKKNDSSPEALTFLIPNDNKRYEDITQFLTSIDQIEEHTGLIFFSDLEANIQRILKSQVATNLWK